MVKVIVLLKKHDHLTREEFSRHWENHGPLAARLVPGVKRYVQNHLLQVGEGENPPFDGVAELWLEDQESLRAMFDFNLTDEGKMMRDDQDRFVDRNRMVILVAEEKVMKE